jgi:glutaredoxin 3
LARPAYDESPATHSFNRFNLLPAMEEITLYVKTGCPWCTEAEAFLRDHEIPYQRIDVLHDSSAFDQMREISGQNKAPTMQYGAEILADFGASELERFLRQRDVLD